MSTPLSPTERSTPRREKERAQTDRAALYDVLATALVCHLAVVVDGVPLALPTVFARRPSTVRTEGGTLYLHGSVASRSLVQGPGQDVSVTLDRPRRHRARPVRLQPLDELPLRRRHRPASRGHRRRRARARPRPARRPRRPRPGPPTLRRPTRKELAATTVLALPLHEASVKRRDGDPSDEDEDVEAGGVWAGVVPLRMVAGEPRDRRGRRRDRRTGARGGAGAVRSTSDPCGARVLRGWRGSRS